jgi:plastocyanin
MRFLAMTVALFVCAALTWSQTRALAAANPETITVRMSSFKYEPERLRLRAGVPVRLRFVNESRGGHDFSAPDFFASSDYPAGSSPPPEGRIAVPANGSAEITIVPKRTGMFRVTCTHFLHTLFGMTGEVEVVGPAG